MIDELFGRLKRNLGEDVHQIQDLEFPSLDFRVMEAFLMDFDTDKYKVANNFTDPDHTSYDVTTLENTAVATYKNGTLVTGKITTMLRLTDDPTNLQAVVFVYTGDDLLRVYDERGRPYNIPITSSIVTLFENGTVIAIYKHSEMPKMYPAFFWNPPKEDDTVLFPYTDDSEDITSVMKKSNLDLLIMEVIRISKDPKGCRIRGKLLGLFIDTFVDKEILESEILDMCEEKLLPYLIDSNAFRVIPHLVKLCTKTYIEYTGQYDLASMKPPTESAH